MNRKRGLTAKCLPRRPSSVPHKACRFLKNIEDRHPSVCGFCSAATCRDGKHTNVASFSAVVSVFPSLDGDAMVCFHDVNLVIGAMFNTERFLRYSGTAYRAFFLPIFVGVVSLCGNTMATIRALDHVAIDHVDFIGNARCELHAMVAQAVVNGEGAHRCLTPLGGTLTARET
jgi:hypothetical protein